MKICASQLSGVLLQVRVPSLCVKPVLVGDRKVLEPHFVTQLSRCGYERMTVPAIGRIVFINNFMKPGSWLSNLRIARRCYPTLRKFLKDINIDSSVNVEIHYEDRTHIFSPIDDQKEFVVPEVSLF